MIKISFPFTEEKIHAFKVGDWIATTDIIYTGQDI